MSSKKEQILQAIENRLKTIIKGDKPLVSADYVYDNTVSYVDRQYLQFEMEDVVTHAKPWVILNNDAEKLTALPGGNFQSNIHITIIGFVEATKTNPNLDTLMNSLQSDILACMISDSNISGLADYLEPREVFTVSELIWPHGGFACSYEIIFTFSGLRF